MFLGGFTLRRPRVAFKRPFVISLGQAAPFEDQSMLPPPLPTENHNKETTEATKAAMLAMANAGPLSRLLTPSSWSAWSGWT